MQYTKQAICHAGNKLCGMRSRRLDTYAALMLCCCLLPQQNVADHLPVEDLLVARLVCRLWQKDLGQLVHCATITPSWLSAAAPKDNSIAVGSSSSSSSSAQAPLDCKAEPAVCHKLLHPAPLHPTACRRTTRRAAPAVSGEATFDAAAAQQDGQVLEVHQAQVEASSHQPHDPESSPRPRSVDDLLDDAEAAAAQQSHWLAGQHVGLLRAAFPHCERVDVDISRPQEQQMIYCIINSLATGTAAAAGACYIPAGAPVSSEQTEGLEQLHHTHGIMHNPMPGQESQQQMSSPGANHNPQPGAARRVAAAAAGRAPWICLKALHHSYHCHSHQDHPASPAGAGAQLFALLQQLPHHLHPRALSMVKSCHLGVFPDRAEDWLVLQGLPCLTELVLPSFRPALPHEQLPFIAALTQLRKLTISVQVGLICHSSTDLLMSLAWPVQDGRAASQGVALHCTGGRLFLDTQLLSVCCYLFIKQGSSCGCRQQGAALTSLSAGRQPAPDVGAALLTLLCFWNCTIVALYHFAQLN
jgi:hypothetical protein